MRRVIANAFFIAEFLAIVTMLCVCVAMLFGMPEEKLLPFIVPYAFYLLLFITFILCVASTKKIPIRLYLPILVADATFIYVDSFSMKWLSLIAVMLQFGVVFYCFDERRKHLRNKFGLIPAGYFQNEKLSKARFISTLFAFIALFLIGFGYAIFKATQSSYAESENIRLKYDGLYTDSKTYKKGKQKVYLIGMIHYGDKSFYENALAEIPEQNSVVLLEGISDNKGIATDKDYRKSANRFGATEQNEFFNATAKKNREFSNVDVDLEHVSPEAREYIELKKKRKIGLDGYLALLSVDPSEAKLKIASDKFHKERETRVMAIFDFRSIGFDHIIIPWGAAHMAAFSAALRERGFKLVETKEQKVLSFW